MKNFGFVLRSTAAEVVARERRRDADERRHAWILGADRQRDPRAERHARRPRSARRDTAPCMKSSAARKSSISPGPLLKVPALAPAPRKLKRSTAQPIRLSAFAA